MGAELSNQIEVFKETARSFDALLRRFPAHHSGDPLAIFSAALTIENLKNKFKFIVSRYTSEELFTDLMKQAKLKLEGAIMYYYWGSPVSLQKEFIINFTGVDEANTGLSRKDTQGNPNTEPSIEELAGKALKEARELLRRNPLRALQYFPINQEDPLILRAIILRAQLRSLMKDIMKEVNKPLSSRFFQCAVTPGNPEDEKALHL